MMMTPKPASTAGERTPLLASPITPPPLTPTPARRRSIPRNPAPPVYLFPAVFLSILAALGLFAAWNLTLGECRVKWACDILSGDEPRESVWARNAGAYAPWAPGQGAALPRGCYVDQVSVLHRHTGRYPTPHAAEALRATLDKIANRGNRSPTNRPEFAFLQHTDFALRGWEFGRLTDQGRRAAWESGRSYTERYPNLELFVRSTDLSRVAETARFWREGYAGFEFNSSRGGLEPDVMISEGRRMNNTLSVHSCRAFNALTPPAGRSEYLKVVRLLRPAAARLNRLLDPQPRLDEHDVFRIAGMCGFDTTVRGGPDPANWEWSRWCRVLSASEWEIAGYVADVERWYRVGQGGRYSAVMGAGWVNELLARLHDAAPADRTTVNRTLADDEATFPRGGKRLFVDFTHDNEMVEILTALGARKLRTKLPTRHLPKQPKSRRFVLARLVPFGARWAVERVVCPRKTDGETRMYPTKRPPVPKPAKPGLGKTYVRLLINNTPTHIDHMACRSSPYHGHHMCELAAFAESQTGARDADWGVCGRYP